MKSVKTAKLTADCEDFTVFRFTTKAEPAPFGKLRAGSERSRMGRITKTGRVRYFAPFPRSKKTGVLLQYSSQEYVFRILATSKMKPQRQAETTLAGSRKALNAKTFGFIALRLQRDAPGITTDDAVALKATNPPLRGKAPALTVRLVV